MIEPKKVVLAITPLLLPALVTFIIHHFFQVTFGENNLTLGIYSRDIYIPLGVGAIFCLYHMVGSGVTVTLRPYFLGSTLVLCSSIVLFLKNYLHWITVFSHSVLVITLLLSCLAALVLAFLSTLRVSQILAFISKKNSAAVYVLIATISLLNYPNVLKFFWREAAYLTARSVFYIYQLFGVQLKYRLTPVSFNLDGGGFAIKIIMGCSGLEGVFFFIFGFSLIQCLEKRNIDWKVVRAYFAGMVFLFLLNTLRISLFYLVGIQFEKLSMGRTGKDVVEAAFHNHLGWILYLLGIIIFIRIYRKIEGGEFRSEQA